MYMVSALSYKNMTMSVSKAPYSSSESWFAATRRAIPIVEQIYNKPDIDYYKALLTNVVEILSSNISEADMEAFYTGDKKIIYNEFGYNIMELAGTIGSLPGVSYGLYLIVRSIEKSSSSDMGEESMTKRQCMKK
ncbi:MAG: hypothetical protein RMJ38_03980 [candidate division WOR-3 bacterium]|nr:hypothetical protein [candidate division WOR-3 bacterium]MDW8150580.1 hypothetical protein [candidate division WOR-3 bacterium]